MSRRMRPRVFAPAIISSESSTDGVSSSSEQLVVPAESGPSALHPIGAAGSDRDRADGRVSRDRRQRCRCGGVTPGPERPGVIVIPLPQGVLAWLATGHTDMRKGFPSLSLQVQQVLRRDTLSGPSVLLPRPSGRSVEGNLARRSGSVLLTKRLERGRFFVAICGGGRGDDLPGSAWLSLVGDRLAPSAGELAPTSVG